MSEEHYLDQIKKCVTFIFVMENNEPKPLGTGFFVGVGLGNKRFTTYLVTAKHVIQAKDGTIYPIIHLRLNTKDGAPLVEFCFDQKTVFTHPDKEVDLVCIPCNPFDKKYDVKHISDDFFADKTTIKEKGITEGDEIFYAGLFNPYIGEQKNHPLIRFGKVSSLTNEKIRITKPGDPLLTAHLYLFETHSLSGFSGSPVFFKLDRLREKNVIHYGNPEVYLAGVMKGHYYDFISTPIIDFSKRDDNILRELNLGIAAVTPCYLLKEILFSPSEVEHRKNLKNLI